jgi:hypothetical protein
VAFTLGAAPAKRATDVVRMLGFRDDETGGSRPRTARQAAFAAHAAATASTASARPGARRFTS